MTDPSKRRRNMVLVLVVLQGSAALLFLQEEDRRRTDPLEPFVYERVSHGPVLETAMLTRADGSQFSTTTLRGRPVLLHFWATWCPPCREELPALLQLQADHPGMQVIALALDDDWAKVRKFFGGAVPSVVFRDPSGVVSKTYAVGTLPESYLVDRNGAAQLRFSGARNWESQEAHDVLDRFR